MPAAADAARRRRARLATAALATLAWAAAGDDAQPLRVAVASNFQAAFAALAEGYPKALAPTYGSSGLLHAQIVQGRPFDVFLSADRARPLALVERGRASAPVTYAHGRLVLLANAGAPGPAWLATAKRVALANPDTAPYGRAAAEVLAGLDAAPRRVVGLNVAQAFHFAMTGAVDGAFVALAQVLAKDVPAERYWLIPDDRYAPIEQVAVAVGGGDEARARAFLDHLSSDAAQNAIRAAGYR